MQIPYIHGMIHTKQRMYLVPAVVLYIDQIPSGVHWNSLKKPEVGLSNIYVGKYVSDKS